MYIHINILCTYTNNYSFRYIDEFENYVYLIEITMIVSKIVLFLKTFYRRLLIFKTSLLELLKKTHRIIKMQLIYAVRCHFKIQNMIL